MSQYIIRRLIMAIFLMFMVATLVFLVIRMVPGDIVDAMVDPEEEEVSPEVLAARRRALGLDEPLPVQYVRWIGDFVRGDWGISLWDGRSVLPDLMRAFPRTVELVVTSTIVAWLIGIPMGIFAAVNHGNWVDRLSSTISFAVLSIPTFVTATMLILTISLYLRLLPSVTGGFVRVADDPLKHLKHLILPTLSLGLRHSAVLMQMTRASLLEVLGEDYIRTARAKGLTEPVVRWRHALKNALIPVVTIGGMRIAGLLGGSVIIEAIFMWPGVGSIVLNAVDRRDYTMLQGTVFLIAATFTTITVVVDIVNAYLDPRIRYS